MRFMRDNIMLETEGQDSSALTFLRRHMIPHFGGSELANTDISTRSLACATTPGSWR